MTAGKGDGGTFANIGGSGGTASGGDINLVGESGEHRPLTTSSGVALGGSSPRGGSGGGPNVGGNGDSPGGGGSSGNHVGGSNGGAGGAGGIVITVYATSSPTAAGNDYAEMFPVSNPGINAGDIVAVDAGVPVSMKLAQAGDGSPLAGVISTQPGHLLGDINAAGERPVALMGRVPVKVTAEGGPIKIGDRIAPSSVPGVGRKAAAGEPSVGIALEAAAQEGMVMVFITLQDGLDISAVAGQVIAQLASTTVTSTENLFATSTSVFADASQSIKDALSAAASTFTKAGDYIYAKVGAFRDVIARRVQTDELCIGEACIDQAKWSAITANVSTTTFTAIQTASTTQTDTLCLGGDCRSTWPIASQVNLSDYVTFGDLSAALANIPTTTASYSYATTTNEYITYNYSTTTEADSFAARFFAALKDRLVAWFADAMNGITKFFAREGYFSDKLCVGATCITESELQALLHGASPSPTSVLAPPSPPPAESPQEATEPGDDIPLANDSDINETPINQTDESSIEAEAPPNSQPASSDNEEETTPTSSQDDSTELVH